MRLIYRSVLGWRLAGDEFHAHLSRTSGQRPQHAFAIALFIVILSLICILLALGEYRVDQPSKLVSSGSDGFGLVHARAHTSEVCTQCRLAAAQGCCGHSQGLGSAIDDTLGLAAHDLATSNLGAWTQ